MRQSRLFTKTRREAPKDEVSKNAILLIRAGFVNKEFAGVYSYLPLGWRVIEKIKKVVSEEMSSLGSQELLMSSLQQKEVWEQTDRWDDEKVDIWFKSKLKNNTEIGFGWSHEEPIAEMMKSHVASYQDLPVAVHQFQNKFRNEARAKSGVMRGREFIMKDMYYFAEDEESNIAFYDKAKEAYFKVFRRLGLGDITFITSASGGVFTDKFSHEFQTVCDAGEDVIYVSPEKNIALNAEIYTEKTLNDLGMQESDFVQKKTAEVGNIFNFGSGKSEELGLFVKDKTGGKKPVHLSSYGIGISRLMGVVSEVLSDDKGLVWPDEIAPFDVHLISLSEETRGFSDEIYSSLESAGVEVLYDDRSLRAGEKFNDADLIGIPKAVIVGSKNMSSGKVEINTRNSGEVIDVAIEDLVKEIKRK